MQAPSCRGHFLEERPKNAAALLLDFVNGGIVAPPHWAFEVGNILWMAERAKRLGSAAAQEFIDLVVQLNIATDSASEAKAMFETRALAHQHNITVYDAAYLELAMRRRATLVSKDKALLKAAKNAGVATIQV